MKLENLSIDFDQRIYENLANSSVKKSSYDLTNHHFSKNIYANLAKLSLDDPSIYSTLIDSIEKNPTYENLSSTHVYMNLKDVKDKPLKSTETDVLDKHSSNTKTENVKNKFEINQTPNCHDKSDLYRTKMSSTMVRILPSLRQRRSLRRPRRYRRRSITPFRSNSNRRQQQQQQQTMNSKRRVSKSVTNQLYNELSQTIISQTEEIFAHPIQFQPVIAYYPTQQFSLNLEKGESIQQVIDIFVFNLNEMTVFCRKRKPKKSKTNKNKNKKNCINMKHSKISFLLVRNLRHQLLLVSQILSYHRKQSLRKFIFHQQVSIVVHLV